MAANTLYYYYFFISLLCISTVLCRTLDQKPKTCFLDLSASAQRMLEIFSFDPEKQQQQEVGEKSDSPLTLKLFSRDTIRKTPFKNYEELILSRLERDSARLNYLSKKLTAVKNEDNDFDQTEIEAPLTSGLQQGSGEYFARFGVGTPARQFYLAIDTGSDINWIQCAPCMQCYNQVDPLFESSGSSSYKPLSCDSPSCQALNDPGCSTADNTCAYRASYGDGSFTQGDYVTESLTFGNSVVDNVAIGCGRNNGGLFVGSAGLLGLGRSAVSLPSQIGMQSFSYCLVRFESTSASTLDFSSITIPSNAVTTPLLNNPRHPIFYYVGLTGISVGGEMLSISASEFSINPNGEGGVIVDSGSTFTGFPASIYNVFRDAFVSAATELSPGGSFGPLDTCFNVSYETGVNVPIVAFHFGTQSLTLPPDNYMLQVSEDLLCFAFAVPPSSIRNSIIGSFQQQGMRVTYDVSRSLIGFALDQC